MSVTNSSFDSNSEGAAATATSSLHIVATGSITLNGVSASDFDHGDGALLESQKSITVKNSVFNSNGDGTNNNSIGYGLRVADTSKGSVLLDHVDANSNYEEAGIRVYNQGGAVTMNTIDVMYNRYGLDIDNCWEMGGVCTAPSTAVTLSNLTGYYNTHGGLRVKSNGNITVSNISSSDAYNTGSAFAGIELNNGTATAAKTVTLTNATSNANYLGGVIINTRGAVTLNHVNASSNYYGIADGIRITSSGSGAVNILGTLGDDYAGGNNGYGIHIVTNGAVSISKMEANYNVLDNLNIDNTGGKGAVSLHTVSFGSSTTGSGIIVNSRGAITLTNANATYNALDGIVLDNHTAASSQAVTIKTTSKDINIGIGNNLGSALLIHSRGNVSLTGIYDYNWSNQRGRIIIDNTYGTGTVTLLRTDVSYVNDLSVAFPAAITIQSRGAVTITGIESDENFDRGLYVDNSTATGSPGVTLKDASFDNNDLAGFDILSKGAVKLTDISAYSNDGGEAGGVIRTAGSVTLDATGSGYYDYNTFEYNATNGLFIEAGGAVVIKKSSFSYNAGGYGLTVAPGAASVSMTAFRANSNTPMYGVNITANGAITLANFETNNNSTYGIWLDNSSGTAGVTLTGLSIDNSDISNNPSYNLTVRTNGALKMSYLSISGSPVAVNFPLTVGNVSLTNLNISNTSGNPAFAINSSGTVTATNISTSSTSGSGLVINNFMASSAKAVTITNFSDTSSAGSYALMINSRGTVTLSRLNLDGQDIRPFGLYVDNTASTIKSPVTVKKASGYTNSFYDFTTAAVWIQSHGQVTLDGLYVWDNDIATGLFVNSDLGGVTVKNSTFAYNTNGMDITAGGAIVLNSIYAPYNDLGFGVRLDNSPALSAAPVTVTNLQTYDNDTGGLHVTSRGAVTITNLNAYSQDVSGYALYVDTDGSVTLGYTGSNRNNLYSNVGSSLFINAGGSVTLKRVDAYNNTGGGHFGADITAGGSVSITDADFDNNPAYGLHVRAGGAITLTNIECQNNDGTFGAELDNHLGSGGITINGLTSDWAQFDDNIGTNLILNTTGALTLKYVNADGATRALDIPSTVGNVNFNYVDVDNITGGFYGINLTSNGTVSLSHIDCDNTPGGGIWIDNTSATSSKNVTLLDIDAYDDSGGYGIYVSSKGVISVKDIDLDGNNLRDYGLWLNNSLSTTKAGVTISGSNEITNFDEIGLFITSNGSVSIAGAYIYDTSAGIIVENTAGGNGTGSVTITNTTTNYSEYDGVNIETNGNVTLTNVTSDENGDSGSGHGIFILVHETPTHFSGTLALTGINTSYNEGYGLYVSAWKQITLKDHYAYDNRNGGCGAYLYTRGGVSVLNPGGTLENYYGENDSSNLVIDALGDVVVQKVDSYGSDTGHGVLITTNGRVTLTNVDSRSNILSGMDVTAGGLITASGLSIQYNTLSGAELDNHPGTAGITVKNSTFYNNNGATPYGGLVIASSGTVLLDKVTAESNSSHGVHVTISAPSTAAVTVTKSTFRYNTNDGLQVISQGNITLNGVTADYNDDSGAVLDNHAGTGKVTILGINSFIDNDVNGLGILSSGAVIISGVTANDNDGVGIAVVNSTAGLGLGTVTITGAIIKNNNDVGISINSNGTVTLSKVEAIANGLVYDHSGIDITTNGFNALVQNSVVIANGKHGIFANVGAGKTLTVKKTYYMGNNRIAPADSDANLHVAAGGTLLIIP